MTVAPETVLELTVQVTYALLAFGIACAFTRLVRGPSLPDRVVALDYTAILAVGFAALSAIDADEPAFIDVSVALALAAFLATVAFARFADGGRARRAGGRASTEMPDDRVARRRHAAVWRTARGGRRAGLLRLPDVLIRMHSSTKAGTLGVGFVLAASAVYYGEPGPSFRALATIVFLLITAPVAAHMIARAAYRTGVPLWDQTVVDELRVPPDRRDRAIASDDPAAH